MNESKKFTYVGGETDVQWDGRLCIHYGECGRASGDLFVGGRQPWCQPDHSSDEEIRDVLLRCPTGALTATFADGSGIEARRDRHSGGTICRSHQRSQEFRRRALSYPCRFGHGDSQAVFGCWRRYYRNEYVWCEHRWR